MVATRAFITKGINGENYTPYVRFPRTGYFRFNEGQIDGFNAVSAVTIMREAVNSGEDAPATSITTLTNQGDLLTSDGSENVVLSLGPNGYILTADSSQVGGLRWAPSSSGGGSGIVDPTPNTIVKRDSGGAVKMTDLKLTKAGDTFLTWNEGNSGSPGKFIIEDGNGKDFVQMFDGAGLNRGVMIANQIPLVFTDENGNPAWRVCVNGVGDTSELEFRRITAGDFSGAMALRTAMD